MMVKDEEHLIVDYKENYKLWTIKAGPEDFKGVSFVVPRPK